MDGDATSASDEADGMCLGQKLCPDRVDGSRTQEVRTLRCSHCSAKSWNILGDADTGYVLTHGSDSSPNGGGSGGTTAAGAGGGGGGGGAKQCLVREAGTGRALLGPCDDPDVPYTPLQLQFASASDVKTMASPAARFIGASADGDLKAMKAMRKRDKIDVNVRDWDELAALIPAASAGHLDIVRYLLKEGADVDAKDKDGITALMEASIMGHGRVVDALLAAGAEVDAGANSGVTALWLAAGEGRADVLRTLLASGALATVTRVDGITALMTAAVSGHAEAVGLLLEGGADPAAVDGDGLSPLHNAAENGTVAVLGAMIEGYGAGTEEARLAYVDQFSASGFSPLIIAAAHGHAGAVEYLIGTAGADANAVHDNGVSALMYAAASGHVDVMALLLDRGGADVNQLHSNGGSALLEASTGNSTEAIEFLLQRGAEDDVLDEDGVTPVMAIASQGSPEGLEAVVGSLRGRMSAEELREHLNLASYSGGTAVMFSAAGGHAAATRRLIELGANVNDVAQATPEYLEKLAVMIEDGTWTEDEPHVDGVTALHVAAQGGHLECVRILLDAGAELGVEDDEDRTALFLAVKGNYGEVASALVKAGADPSTPYVDDDGEPHNLLLDAVIVENEDFARLLIESGADLYHEDENQVTTLLQASHRGLTDIVGLLLEKHASGGTKTGWVNSASDEGITPIIAASSEGHREVVEALIAAGADIDAIDKDGTSSLMASAARGHVEIVEALVKNGAKVDEQNVDGHTALMFAYNGKNQVETLWERYGHFASDEEDQDDGGTGAIIKESLSNHTKMVDLLISSGANQKIKDKEGHVAKDFDFQPDMDADVLQQEKLAAETRDSSRNEL